MVSLVFGFLVGAQPAVHVTAIDEPLGVRDALRNRCRGATQIKHRSSRCRDRIIVRRLTRAIKDGAHVLGIILAVAAGELTELMLGDAQLIRS